MTNNLGGVIHTETDEEEIKKISNIFGVNIEPINNQWWYSICFFWYIS